MKKEIEVASWWWTTQLRLNDLSQEQVLVFQNCLTDLLLQKYQNHWYEDNPLRGHAYRSILYEGNKLDAVLLQAAEKAAIKNLNDRLQATPMIMWIDPGEIEVKYFITNASNIIYRAKKETAAPASTATAAKPADVKTLTKSTDH